MFTNVFDVEMKRLFFDERIQRHYKFYIWDAVFDRLMAYEAYRVAVKDLMRFEHTIQYAICALKNLRLDKKWDKYVKSDKLEQKAHSLLKVTPSMREFHEWRLKILLPN